MNTQALEMPLRYPLSLALLDYAPVVLTLAGQWLLLAALPQAFAPVEGWALAGAAMMFAGGCLKATWKTIIAATQRDIRWMEHALFPLLAPGAALFAWAVLQASRQASAAGAFGTGTVAIPLLASLALLALSFPRLPHSKKWFLPLIALLTVAMGVVAVCSALLARGAGDTLAAGLFIAGFAASLVTAGLSRRAATINAQWVMEFANTASALLGLAGALHLGQFLATSGAA